MTPKEKAFELVDKFRMNVLDYGGSGLNTFKAIQCALIAVDEILEMDLPILEEDTDTFYDYWEEVKQEIEKL